MQSGQLSTEVVILPELGEKYVPRKNNNNNKLQKNGEITAEQIAG